MDGLTVVAAARRLLWALADGSVGRRLWLWTSWPRAGGVFCPARLRPGVWERAVEVRWEPRDCWIGLFYEADVFEPGDYLVPGMPRTRALDFYACLVPTLVLHVYFRRAARGRTPVEVVA